MRLTKQTNYALRILMYCAANQGNLSRIGEISAAYSVSELFLFKILQPLVEHGFIYTVRGRKGGIALARPANQITLAEVIKITEENFALSDCFENEQAECPLVKSCGLNIAFHKALNAFFEVLSNINLADISEKRYDIQKKLGIRTLEII